MDEKGYVKTDANQRTNKKFVYAAGDVANGMKQVVVACAQGAMAASSAYIDLQNPYWAH
jgi:thioredoxin reductase (NADPH)